MIGKLTLPADRDAPGSGTIEAVLEDDGKLRCKDRAALRLLGMRLDLYRRQYSPAQGPFGVLWLNQMAADYGGKVEIEEKPSKPGTVY